MGSRVLILKNIKMKNLVKKYRIWEYILQAIGVIVLGKITFEFVNDTLENSVLNGIALVVAVLMLTTPATIVQIAKNKAGENEKSIE